MQRIVAAHRNVPLRGRVLFSAILSVLLLSAPELHAENRLSGSRSRYLQQHATNPVDWYPWGEEAFAKAKTEDKPVFLSVGYSTCHWCQVMEKESFADPEIGALMNDVFVSVKVDREERPDIDAVYLAAARTLTGDAGWPNNVILTPAGKPFFATSYVGRDQFRALIVRVGTMWREQREQLEASAALVIDALRPAGAPAEAGLGADTLREGYRQLAARFDAKHGGFLPSPKFPAPHQVMFLLRYWRRTGDATALSMVETTLGAMRRGAIHDVRGGGFHRYAGNDDWSAPHYEKMLYDQALISLANLEAYQATGKREYAATARGTFRYVLRDLRSAGGTFFAAQDADEEFYRAPDRRGRRKPSRDEKIVTDWNGLMIAALAFGGVVFDDAGLTDAARRAADAILASRGDSGLHHQPGQVAFLDDYAFLVWGLLNLYEATFDLKYLESAIALEDESLVRFRDSSGRFFVTPSDGEALLVRPRETGDGAIPAGSSVQLMNLVRIARITADPRYATAAAELVRSSSDDVSLAPSLSAHFLCGLDFLVGPSFEVVLSGRDVSKLKRAVFDRFTPNKVVVYRPLGAAPPITRIAPYTELQTAGAKAMAFVCTNFKCKLPTSDARKVRALLER
ncbi:MAG: thioredoxin domain-containing protein [Acidobacteria bacterium]|nr:thioredoxin domain-containing protein [Acidobacteriota bacterium]